MQFSISLFVLLTAEAKGGEALTTDRRYKRGRPAAVQNHGEVLDWYRQGFTYEEIADKHEAKYSIRPAVGYLNDIRRRAGVPGRAVHDPALMPWEIAREHRNQLDARCLRVEARIRAGKDVGDYSRRIWTKWRAGLAAEGTVVHYAPELGFVHVTPRPGIDTDLVRVPGVWP